MLLCDTLSIPNNSTIKLNNGPLCNKYTSNTDIEKYLTHLEICILLPTMPKKINIPKIIIGILKGPQINIKGF